MHAPLDAVLALQGKHTFAAADITSVRVGMPRKCVDITGIPQERKRDPRNVVDCRAHLCIANMLVTGHLKSQLRAGLAEPGGARADAAHRLLRGAHRRGRVPAHLPGSGGGPRSTGGVHKLVVKTPSGEPETMLTPAQMRAKFSLLVTPVLGAAGEAALFERIMHMHDDEAVAALLQAASPAARPP